MEQKELSPTAESEASWLEGRFGGCSSLRTVDVRRVTENGENWQACLHTASDPCTDSCLTLHTDTLATEGCLEKTGNTKRFDLPHLCHPPSKLKAF